MGRQAKSASELAQLVRQELGVYVDVDRVWIAPHPDLGWYPVCVGKPLLTPGFQYMADRIAEKLRERFDLVVTDES